jgi:hypothetical protein
LQRITKALHTSSFPSFTKACLYLSDVEKLEKLAEQAETNENLVSTIFIFSDPHAKLIDKCELILSYSTPFNISHIVKGYRDSGFELLQQPQFHLPRF